MVSNDSTVRERLQKEQTELNDKIVKLEAFIDDKVKFTSVTSFQRRMLKKQLKYMRKYHYCLCRRIIFLF